MPQSGNRKSWYGFFWRVQQFFKWLWGRGGESCRLFYADEFGFLVFRWLAVKKQAKNDVFELFFNDFDLKKLRFLEHAPSLKKFKGAVKQNRCRENGTKRGTVWENLATEIERGGGFANVSEILGAVPKVICTTIHWGWTTLKIFSLKIHFEMFVLKLIWSEESIYTYSF